MKLHRRQFNRLVFAGAASGLLIRPRTLLADATNDLQWSCRIVTFEAEPEHDSPPVITSVDTQADGDLIALVGDDHLVRLCSKETGEVVAKLHSHTDWVRTALFESTGDRLFTAGNDRNLLVWDTVGFQRLNQIDQQVNSIVALARRPNSNDLASVGFHETLTIYDATTGRIVSELTCPCADMRTVTYSHDGSLIAAGGRSGVIRVWDAETGREVVDLHAHRRRIHQVIFLDDGATLVSCADDRLIKISRLDEGEAIELPRRPCKVQCIELIGSNLIASAGSDNLIRLWDRETIHEIGQLVGHRGTITSLSFDGASLYSGSFDTELRIWKVSEEVARRIGTVPELGRRPLQRPID